MSNVFNNASWGTVDCELDRPTTIALGTLQLTLTRTATDVFTTFEYPNDVFWSKSDIPHNERRTVFSKTASPISIMPACPARNVVARPVRDIFIPAGESSTAYVGYPVWLRAVIQDNIVLADLATELMSETWLGPNTRQGEIAYATPTQARLSRDNLPQTLHSIRTPITIRNTSSHQLQVSRVSIPAPKLSIFRCDNRLWTSAVSIICEETLSQARVEIGEDAPEFLQGAERLADARVQAKGNSVRRAIGYLLS